MHFAKQCYIRGPGQRIYCVIRWLTATRAAVVRTAMTVQQSAEARAEAKAKAKAGIVADGGVSFAKAKEAHSWSATEARSRAAVSASTRGVAGSEAG